MRSFVGILSCFMTLMLLVSACGVVNTEQNLANRSPVTTTEKAPKPTIPPLQREILDDKNSTTESPLGKFDFKNFTYPLPRGWQDTDSGEITLQNGVRRMTEDRIGMSYVTTKYMDLTDDGKDEAFVILKVATGSITITQIVYVFKWINSEPELIWYFSTGDRADGGLRRFFIDKGALVVELFGIDRYIFNQMETTKIVGDDERLCCPTHFTRTRYKRSGNSFVLDGDRWTYSLEDEYSAPVKNMNEIMLEEGRGPKK